MASKVVGEYAKAAQGLIDALRAAAAQSGAGAQALAAMTGPGEQVPDVAFLAELLARRLEHDRAELERADQQKHSDAADVQDPRARRDHAAHELYALLLEVRRTVDTLFGAAWRQKLLIPANLRDDAVPQLLRAGRDVMKALKEKELPKPIVAGVKTIDPKPWQKSLKAAVKELEDASSVVGAETRALDDSNVAKATALATFERSFAAASNIARGLLLLGDHEDAADRVPRVPRAPRRGKRGAGGDPPAGDPSPPPPA